MLQKYIILFVCFVFSHRKHDGIHSLEPQGGAEPRNNLWAPKASPARMTFPQLLHLRCPAASKATLKFSAHVQEGWAEVHFPNTSFCTCLHTVPLHHRVREAFTGMQKEWAVCTQFQQLFPETREKQFLHLGMSELPWTKDIYWGTAPQSSSLPSSGQTTGAKTVVSVLQL